MHVRRLLPDDLTAAARWDAFVQACPDATFFHRSGWQRVLRDTMRHDTHFLYCEHEDRMCGVLPLAHVRSWVFGSALVGLPFAVYGGVAASDPAAALALERHACDLARELDVGHLELRHRQQRHPDWPVQHLYVTFRKTLEPSDEANLLAIPRKQRAMVRKGIGNGLTSRVDDDARHLFPLYADNVHRHGTPALPRAYFEALLKEFGPDADVLTVSGPDGRPLSSVLSFFFRDEVLPYYAGDDLRARELAANDFKYWELMRRATARGVRVFDYGRSKQGTGTFAFKKNWGFEPTPLHYEYQLYRRADVPQHNPANARYRLLIESWRRLPLPFVNWLGPFVVRSLG